MAYAGRVDRAGRTRVALGVFALEAAGIYLLILALGQGPTSLPSIGAALLTFDVAPPPVAVAPARHATQPRASAAAPANRRSSPIEIVAPPPSLPLLPTMVAAPVAGSGQQPQAGAAPTFGPGTGAGGAGVGLGSGGSGAGTGGGSSARLIRGAIGNGDYPHAPRRAGIGGTVVTRFTVGVDGRASGCAIDRSSGDAELDGTTCRLIERRFHYAPATDGAGHPVAEQRGWRQRWWLEPRGAAGG